MPESKQKRIFYRLNTLYPIAFGRLQLGVNTDGVFHRSGLSWTVWATVASWLIGWAYNRFAASNVAYVVQNDIKENNGGYSREKCIH